MIRLGILGTMACSLTAFANSAPTLRIPKTAQPPALEQFLDGSTPKPGAELTGFRQRHPGDGTPVSQKTTAYLSYDAKNLYVVFVCGDQPDRIRAHMAKREQIGDDDRVAIYLDTFNDRKRAYVFEINPLGIQRDGTLLNGQSDIDYTFDTLWYSEGRLTGDGYVVRMTLPFKSLRFPGAPLQTWRIALNRRIIRSNEDSYRPYISDRIASFFEQMSPIEGLEDVSPGHNAQFIPYFTFARARVLDPSIPRFVTDHEERGGLDSKIVIRDALTLDLTINPDFSQVESDDPQVTINKRFEVYFPEKRPFFIENSSYFATPVNLFFSRRIVDPEFGGRLTGKLGGWSLGALAVDDRAPGRLVSTGDPLYGDHAVIGVGRVERDFSKESHVGFLASVRDFGASSNSVFSFDTRLRLSPTWFLNGQAIYTDTHPLDGRRFTGTGYYADLSRSGRHFNYVAKYTDFSPGMFSAIGFVPRVNIRRAEQYASYTWRPEGGRLLSFGPSVSLLGDTDHKGKPQDWFVDAAFDLELTGQTQLRFERTESWEYYLGNGFRKHLTSATFYSAPRKWLAVSAYYDQGAAINYGPAEGLPPYLAGSEDASFTFTLRPSPRLRLDQVYIFSRLGPSKTVLPVGAISGTAFNNHLARTKINYQFTRALSLRAILDYYAVLPNFGLVDLSRSKRLSADILLTYLIHPGTALYAGYTDRYENLAVSPFDPTKLINTIGPWTPTGRQFFAKISYLFRF